MIADEYNSALQDTEECYDADVYLYNAPIEPDGFSTLAEAVALRSKTSQRPNCILILVTYGGLANSAYQIARLLQNTYTEFMVFTPSVCKSAGTIVTLGASQIIMDVFSELGPLDVQLLAKDEIGDRKSGLLSRSAFEALAQESFDLFSHHMLSIKTASGGLVSFKFAAEIAARMASDLMSPVFSQLNPDVIGSDFRDLQVATHYGERLALKSGNPKPHAVSQLVSGYPSHDFIIDREEAGQLFRSVSEPSDALYRLVAQISDLTHRPSQNGIVLVFEQVSQNDDHTPGEDSNDDQKEAATEDTKPLDDGSPSDRQSDQGKKRQRGSGD